MEAQLQPIHIIYFGIGLLAILAGCRLHDKWLIYKHRKHLPPKSRVDAEKDLLS